MTGPRYDFINQAWSGYDEADGIGFKQVFATTYVNRQRLFVVTHDGYVRLWEEGYSDRLSEPWIEVLFDATSGAANVPNGTTFSVNGGTTITASTATSSNSGTTWGVDSDNEIAWTNLWGANQTRGYSPDSTTPWTTPSAYPVFTSYSSAAGVLYFGLRFRATNGVRPTIATTGTWYLYREQVEQEIEAEFVTRGYSHPEAELSQYHGLILDLQTWNVSFSVNLLADGVNEDVAVAADVTKDRTRHYFPFDAAPYDVTNVNADFFTAGREDYSIQPTSASYAFTPGANVSGGMMQEAREPWEVTLAGRSCRVQVLSTQGRWRLGNCRLTETIDDNAAGPIAS